MAETAVVVDAEVSTVKAMTKAQATKITEQIKQTAGSLPELVTRAYEGRAHEALGYETWEQYVADQFEMTRQNAHRIIVQGKTNRVISAAAGVPVAISARSAGLIVDQLDEVVRQVEKVAGAAKDKASIPGLVDGVVASVASGARANGKAAKAEKASEPSGPDRKVRTIVPAWLGGIIDDVKQAAEVDGESDWEVWVVTVLQSKIREMNLPPRPTPEPKRRGRQSASSDDAEGQSEASAASDEAEAEVIEVDSEPSGTVPVGANSPLG